MNNVLNNLHKSGFSLSKLFNYFIIISFLFPRGYAEFNSTYKNVFTCCIWFSTLIIWVQFFLVYFKEFRKKSILFIMSYFIITIIITLFMRGSDINGFQKLFAYPSIFLFMIFKMRENPKILLNILNNVMLVLFVLNQLVLRSFFSEQYHITFLGHVQMISQLGILSIFCAVVYWILYHNKKKRTILIVLLSLFTMLTVDASSAVISAIILCILAILYKLKIYYFLTFNSKIYIIGGLFLSLLIISLSIINNSVYNNTVTFLDFSGRSFIWLDAVSKFKSSIFLGYGIEGVLLDVFWNQWTNPNGFNYAHNQILQNLLDGGIIGFFAFWFMIFHCCENINNIKSSKYRALINAILIAFSVVMIFESTSLYCYMFMCLAIIYVLPSVINKNDKVVE